MLPAIKQDTLGANSLYYITGSIKPGCSTFYSLPLSVCCAQSPEAAHCVTPPLVGPTVLCSMFLCYVEKEVSPL